MSSRERTLAPSSAYPSTPDETDPNVGLPALSGLYMGLARTLAPSHLWTFDWL